MNEVKKTTIAQLAEKFEVSKRTIMRDLDVISNLGVPIYTQPGYQGGVLIPNSYKFQHSFFTPDEIEDLILALHIIGQFRRKGVKNSILKKIELLVPELAFLKERDFMDYLQIELFQKPLLKDDVVFRKINLALDQEVFLQLETKEQTYCVATLSYALRTSGLYLYASDGIQKLTFAIADILNCEITSKEFVRQDYEKFF